MKKFKKINVSRKVCDGAGCGFEGYRNCWIVESYKL